VEHNHYIVIKVAESDPEVFLIAWLDSQRKNGSVVKTSENFSETEVRAGLRTRGLPETEIDLLIQRARENPW
jgi:hypothetical protein